MQISLSSDSKLHTHDDEIRDRERDGVAWGGDDILHLPCPGSPVSPWALDQGGLASSRLEVSLGAYSDDLWRSWVLDGHYDAREVADCMP